jgi:Ca-activated chloride channel family protein
MAVGFFRHCSLAMMAVCVWSAHAFAADTRTPCTEDAMIVFDASGSMAGSLAEGIGAKIRRIDEVRKALGQALPRVTHFRKIGLITYGPGPYQQCNVNLDLRPTTDAAEPIMQKVGGLNPAGKTPMTQAVEQAAEVLDYKAEPGIVVVLTDGEETCGGAPCELGDKLNAQGARLTVHVIGFRMTSFWTGAQSALDVQCLAKETGGLYIATNSREELVRAFEKTLGCPMMSAWDPRGAQ